MRRLSAIVTSLAVVPVLAGVAACSGSDPVQPVAPSVSKQAGAAAAGGGALGPGDLATFVLEGVLQGVGAQGYMWLSDLLTGDGSGVTDQATMDKLNDIESQLTTINNRLGNIDADLNNITLRMNGDQLNTALQSFNTSSNNVLPVYQEGFTPILDATKKVAAAKQAIEDNKTKPTCPPATASPTASASASATPTADPTCAVDPATLKTGLDTAISDLAAAKTHFRDVFDRSTIFSDYLQQHDALYPKQAGMYSVLYLAGQSLEGKGYATWTDSQRLRNLYLTLSDQEALSALLVLEYDKMFNTGRLKEHQGGYASNHNVEVANLSPEIPWGQVKAGNQMFQAPYDTSIGFYPRGAWLPISPEGKQLGTWFPTSVLDQNPGWVLPDGPQMASLFEKTKNVAPTAEGKTHLGSIWTNSGKSGFEQGQMSSVWGMSSYWTKDSSPSTTAMACYTAMGGEKGPLRVYTLHHVAVMTGDQGAAVNGTAPANAVKLQPQPTDIPAVGGVYVDPQSGKQVQAMKQVECDKEMDQYNKDTFAANVLLTRTIDPATEDFMAQRQTPLPAPTSSSTTG